MTSTLQTLGSSVAKLRALLQDAKPDLQRLQSLQSTLTETLDSLWDIADVLARDQSLWRETLSLVASGRVLAIAAQAEETLAGSASLPRANKAWCSSGAEYSRWLGRGVVRLSAGHDTQNERAAAQLCEKALMLGQDDCVVEEVLDGLVLRDQLLVPSLQALIAALSRAGQRRFVLAMLRLISKRYLPNLASRNTEVLITNGTDDLKEVISGSAALLKSLMTNETGAEDDLCEWLTTNLSTEHMARAVVAALRPGAVRRVLDRSWELFGDKLYIKHMPILQQECIAQVLLITAGYVHRSDPKRALLSARSSVHSSAMSGRLASSSPRVRFLGMVVGMAISRLVDKPDMRMKFDSEEMECAEARWFMDLANVKDEVGSLEKLKATRPLPKSLAKAFTKPIKATKVNETRPAKPMIVEVLDEEGADNELVPYGKPDSDREDDDEDPTMVERNKPKVPVYIRDLIAGLQDTENYERHKLALSTAAPLIRRKADFGSELKDRCEELAFVLVGLGDVFEMDDWHEMRQQAMIATVVAQPRQMGPWYIRAFFNGDYSLSQRGSILSTLGLAARELAGFEKEDKQEAASFASKRLPERLHRIYAETAEVDALARRLEQTMLRPVATSKRRKKIIRNDLAGMVAESFFFPMTGHWQAITQSGPARSIFRDPFLLSVFLKTVAIISSAAGPSTLVLPQMTTEFWQLLLSLRSQALEDPAVLEAVLFSLLTILNMNEDARSLALESSAMLLETQEWVGMIFEKLGGGDEEGERCKVLAAGILVAIKDIVDKYHRLMVGDMVRM